MSCAQVPTHSFQACFTGTGNHRIHNCPSEVTLMITTLYYKLIMAVDCDKPVNPCPITLYIMHLCAITSWWITTLETHEFPPLSFSFPQRAVHIIDDVIYVRRGKMELLENVPDPCYMSYEKLPKNQKWSVYNAFYKMLSPNFILTSKY